MGDECLRCGKPRDGCSCAAYVAPSVMEEREREILLGIAADHSAALEALRDARPFVVEDMERERVSERGVPSIVRHRAVLDAIDSALESPRGVCEVCGRIAELDRRGYFDENVGHPLMTCEVCSPGVVSA